MLLNVIWLVAMLYLLSETQSRGLDVHVDSVREVCWHWNHNVFNLLSTVYFLIIYFAVRWGWCWWCR